MYIEQISNKELFDFINSLGTEKCFADENSAKKFDLGDDFILQMGDVAFWFSDFCCKRGENNVFENVKDFYGLMLDMFGEQYEKDYLEHNAKKAERVFEDGIKIFRAKTSHTQQLDKAFLSKDEVGNMFGGLHSKNATQVSVVENSEEVYSSNLVSYYGFMYDQYGEEYRAKYMEDNAKKAKDAFDQGVVSHYSKRSEQVQEGQTEEEKTC